MAEEEEDEDVADAATIIPADNAPVGHRRAITRMAFTPRQWITATVLRSRAATTTVKDAAAVAAVSPHH